MSGGRSTQHESAILFFAKRGRKPEPVQVLRGNQQAGPQEHHAKHRVVIRDGDDNEAAYGRKVTASTVLTGKTAAPAATAPFMKALQRK